MPCGSKIMFVPRMTQVAGVYRLSDEEADRFALLWAQLDPRGKMRLPEADALHIIARMPAPLGTAAADTPMPPRISGVSISKGTVAPVEIAEDRLLAAELLLRRLPLPPDQDGFVQVMILHMYS